MTLFHMVLLVQIMNRITWLFETTIGVKGGQVGIRLGIRLGLIRLGNIRVFTKTGGEFQSDRLDPHLGLNGTGVFSRFLEQETLRGIHLGGASCRRSKGAQNVLGRACLEDRMSTLSSTLIMPNTAFIQGGATS
jgi:hypothetical protein